MEGTDTVWTSPTTTRLGVDENDDFTDSTLSITSYHLYRTQCDAIMTPILQAGLPCSGMVRTFPRTLVYGTIQYQGLGVPNLYTSQGIAHIDRILKYSHIGDDTTGQLIRASMEQLKLEIGYNGPTLSLPYADFAGLATKSWLQQTWQFMDKYQRSIANTTVPQPWNSRLCTYSNKSL